MLDEATTWKGTLEGLRKLIKDSAIGSGASEKSR
jgi:hypothetical protein